MALSGCTQGGEQVLVYLPTATFTPTTVPTPTITATPQPTSTRSPTRTPTVTPYPWLEIALTITDAQTGEAIAGDVFVGLRVDEQKMGYPIEQNVSTLVFTMPRGVMRADAVYINVIAPDYVNRLILLPESARTEKKLEFAVPLRKRLR